MLALPYPGLLDTDGIYCEQGIIPSCLLFTVAITKHYGQNPMRVTFRYSKECKT